MFIKSEKVHHISSILPDLVFFYGNGYDGGGNVAFERVGSVISLMTKFDNPLLGILVGALFTAVIQSSSASVGILQALASTGMIPLSSAVFVLFGQHRNMYHGSFGIDRNEGKCKAYDGYPSVI